MRSIFFKVTIILLFITNLCFGQRKAVTSKEPGIITITINYKEATDKDTLFLALVDPAFGLSVNYNNGWYRITGKNKVFRITVRVKEKHGYWDLYKRLVDPALPDNLSTVLQRYYWEVGDDITIDLSHKDTVVGINSICSFSGKGSAKYQARYNADSAYKAARLGNKFYDFDEQMNYHRYDQPAIDKALLELEKFRGQMSNLSYAVLKTDIRFRDEYNMYSRAWRFYKSIKAKPDSIKDIFLRVYDQYIKNPDTTGIGLNILSESIAYRQLLYNKFFNESYLFYGNYDPERIIKSIIANTSGLVRDRLMIYAIYTLPQMKNTDLVFREVKAALGTEHYLKIFNNLELTMPGRPFPDFDLPDFNGKRVKLSDFKGKKVLIDFWFNGCGYCQVFYKNTLSKIEHDFKGNEDVVFISICADVTKKEWETGINSNNYTSWTAINLNTDGKGFKHPVVLKNNISGFPFVVLLDKDGKIVARNETWLYDYDKLGAALKRP